MSRSTRRLVLIVFAALTAAIPFQSVGAQTPGRVKCNPNDITADMRVFPEPRVSGTFLSLSDLECGLHVLELQNRDRIDVEVLDRSASDHPIYNVKVTNENIPESDKQHLFILNSIHGNEPAGREGGARVIEDMVDARFMAGEDFIKETMDRFVVHFVFGNPDGWVDGDIYGRNAAGASYSRQNNGTPNRDLNRNFPVQGFLRAGNGTLDQTEGRAINRLLLDHADTGTNADDPSYRGWYLGTDNHGQSVKPVAASGLQIVGEFDFQKSERLAHFADNIEGAMAEYGVLDVLQELNTLTNGSVRPYEWGTLYDILGYSASGSGIDYYNTPGVVNGTGFATEMTASNAPYNFIAHPHLLNQMWVDSVRAINYTMMRDAVDPPSYTFPVGGKAAYVFDPAVVTDADSDGFGEGNATIPNSFTGDDPNVDPNFQFSSYSATRMKFFADLNKYADNPLDALEVPKVLEDPAILSAYDSIVLADNPMPADADLGAWVAALRDFVTSGGNLIVTDAAAPILAELVVEQIQPDQIGMTKRDVGYVDFGDRSHDLNQNLRGIASQTYDVIPIGYPDNDGEAPNWTVTSSAWEEAGGDTAGTNGSGRTIYGELPLGEGMIRFLGALLPQPTEAFFHPYGLQNHAVTYTGYTLLENMLRWMNPNRVDPQTPEADLAITGLDAPASVLVGDEFTYNLSVANQGPTQATGVTLSQSLAPTVRFESASDGCTESDGTVTCDLGTLETGAVREVSITVTPQEPGEFSSFASVTGIEPDLDLSNNSATATTTAACTITGTSANDKLKGTPGRDVICGLGGNDDIKGLGGDDLLIGGDGADRIDGNQGNDLLIGGAGDDDLKGGEDDDSLFGGPGVDKLNGGSGTDSCHVDDDGGSAKECEA